MKSVGFWFFLVLLILLVSSPIFSIGGHESVVSLRTVAMVLIGLTAASAVFSWLWIKILIRELPATHVEIAGRVSSVIRDGGLNPYCRFLIDVQTTNGERMRICGEFGVISRTIQSGVSDLRKGDGENIVWRETVLGTSATAVRAPNHD